MKNVLKYIILLVSVVAVTGGAIRRKIALRPATQSRQIDLMMPNKEKK